MHRTAFLVLALGCLWSPATLSPVALGDGSSSSDLAAAQQRREKAVRRAIKWLEGVQRRDGSFGPPLPSEALGDHSVLSGDTALVYLTLATASGYRSTRSLEAAERHLKSRCARAMAPEENRIQRKTYALATFVLGLDARYGQENARVPSAVRRVLQEIAEWLVATQNPAGDWGYGGAVAGAPPSDISNTAFALLALHAAMRLGVGGLHEGITRTVNQVLRYQQGIGEPVAREAVVFSDSRGGTGSSSSQVDSACGFHYVVGDATATGSATAAGVLSLLSCGEMLAGQGPAERELLTRLERGVWNGVAWLSCTFNPNANPHVASKSRVASEARYHLIYLFFLQRAAAMLRLGGGNESDWYLRAADVVVNSQSSDGSWGSTAPHGSDFEVSCLHDTCFAVLFLLGQIPPVSRFAPAHRPSPATTPR